MTGAVFTASPAGENSWGMPARKAWLGSAPPGVMRYAFPGRPEYVHQARALVRDLFTGTGCEDDATLIVGELANNAIFYTRSRNDGGWFGVEIAFGTFVRVAVADLGGAGWLIGHTTGASDESFRPKHEPQALADRHTDEEEFDLAGLDLPGLEGLALGGRGLAVISGLAVTTGAHGSPATGHTVWADLEVICPPDPFHGGESPAVTA